MMYRIIASLLVVLVVLAGIWLHQSASETTAQPTQQQSQPANSDDAALKGFQLK